MRQYSREWSGTNLNVRPNPALVWIILHFCMANFKKATVDLLYNFAEISLKMVNKYLALNN